MALTEFQKERLWHGMMWAVTRVFLPLLLVAWAVLFVVHRGAMKTLEPLARYGDLNFDQVSFEFDGKVNFTEVTWLPKNAEPEHQIKATTVTVKTPGLMWLLKAAFAKSLPSEADAKALNEALVLPSADRIVWSFDNLSFVQEPFTIGKTKWLGWRSGLPFEAVGCSAYEKWDAKNFDKFTLSEQPLSLTLEFRAMSSDAGVLTARLTRPEASAVQYELTIQNAEPKQLFNQDWHQFESVSQSWALEDLGLIRMRNRICARMNGVSPDAYIEQHMVGVQNILTRNGMSPTQPVLDQYREFVRVGGKLSWNSKPVGTTRLVKLLGIDSQQDITDLRANFALGESASVPFLLDVFDTAAVDGALLAGAQNDPNGGSISNGASNSADADQTAKAANVSPTSRLDNGDKQVKSSDVNPLTMAQQAGDGSAPSTTNRLAIKTNKPTDDPASVAKTSPPVASGSPTGASGTNKLSTSGVSTKSTTNTNANTTNTAVATTTTKETTTKAVALNTPPRGIPRRFSDLERFVGRRIVVHTVLGTTRVGKVKSYTPFGIEMTVETGGGLIVMSFSPNQIKTIGLP